MNKNFLLLGGLGVLALLLYSNSANASSNTSGNAPGNFDLSQLTNDPTDLQYISNLYTELQTRGLTNQQILFMLSQCLYESGILTSVGNYKLISQNNFAGLTNVGGGYASYNSISDFVTAYIGFLTKGSNPLGASSLTDFNNRLQQNKYYTENPQIYYNGLLTYYNELFNIGT